MAKIVEYVCRNEACCGSSMEDIFNDTEKQPEVHPEAKCEHCGGAMFRGDNIKSNSQVWKNV